MQVDCIYNQSEEAQKFALVLEWVFGTGDSISREARVEKIMTIYLLCPWLLITNVTTHYFNVTFIVVVNGPPYAATTPSVHSCFP